MANRIAQKLEILWHEVDSSAWTAPRKEYYYQQIYGPICDTASEIEKKIQELENYSQHSINQCNII